MAELEVRSLRKRFGDSWAVNDVSFQVDAGECLALLGPSGCGKTTTLRCVAGLEDPDNGTVEIRGRTVWGPGGLKVPTEQRDVGLVFQTYALWPHMTVFDNVNYPLRIRRVTKDSATERVHAALDMVGLSGRADAYPSQLSGGQQQRVALARNIAMQPGVLLFDEPLSNLDQRLREEMRFELRGIIDKLGITALYVTHDQNEAFAVADRIAVLRDGRIEQLDTPQMIYANPVNEFVATFVGQANIFPATFAGTRGSAGVFQTATGWTVPSDDIATLAAGQPVKLMVRPESIGLRPVEVADSARDEPDAATGTFVVERIHYLGAVVSLIVVMTGAESLRLRVDASSSTVSRDFDGRLIRAGDAVKLVVHASEVKRLVD